MDEKKLTKYAVHYLSKYDSSKKNLSDILKKKILKANLSGYEKSRLAKSIKDIVTRLENNKLIDDNRYCESKILFLSKNGKSKNFISNYLIKKGINKSEINANLNLFKETNLNWELDSAKLYVRKKRLLELDISYEKKLAKMARAGFNYEICKKILG